MDLDQCSECQELKQRLIALENRVTLLEKKPFQTPFSLPKPEPFSPPKPDLFSKPIPNFFGNQLNGKQCRQCGQEMSHPSSNRYWNSLKGTHDYKSEWICANCDRSSLKMF